MIIYYLLLFIMGPGGVVWGKNEKTENKKSRETVPLKRELLNDV